ncbi:MAG: hypothetical protein IT355_14815 [Gemmatimonadaceae bacterium]|nr:hypothetical protein [Gemmatimonadaceae bacterium]
MRPAHTLLAGALVALASTTPARAQQAAPPERRTVVALNPFALFAEYFAGDIETTVSPTVTVGAGWSAVGINDYNNYRALEAKARYYPNQKAPVGFSVAATAGVATARGTSAFEGDPVRVSRPTIGTELSYQWLLGPTRRFAMVLGVGVKRYLGTEGSFDPINIPLLPTARANIGFAF